MDRNIESQILEYFTNIDKLIFPEEYKENCTLILSGSTGWGIKEGFDSKADWDLHILLSDEEYEKFTKKFGVNYVIDNQNHVPVVFAQIHPMDWLKKRLAADETKILYLWIYSNCVYVKDKLCVKESVDKYFKEFQRDLFDLTVNMYIKFAVRRLDTCSSAKRGLDIAAGINKGEMVQNALRLMCLLKGRPYPYNKWLEKEVSLLYKNDDDKTIIPLCKDCILANDPASIIETSKQLRDGIEKMLTDIYGENRWIKNWWEFNQN